MAKKKKGKPIKELLKDIDPKEFDKSITEFASLKKDKKKT